MWELFCYHTYKFDGHLVDLSVYNSHGQPPIDMKFIKDGVA
jgi:hypothetical protein